MEENSSVTDVGRVASLLASTAPARPLPPRAEALPSSVRDAFTPGPTPLLPFILSRPAFVGAPAPVVLPQMQAPAITGTASGPQIMASARPPVVLQAHAPQPPVAQPAQPPVAHAAQPPVLRPQAPIDFGPGFKYADSDPENRALELHDFLAHRAPGLFGLAAQQSLSIVSGLTRQFLGVDVEALLSVERTMYRMMVPSRDGYVGGSPPIFQALADGQAAYVYIKDRDNDAEHITRLFTGLPPRVLNQLGPGNDDLAPIRQSLLDRMAKGDFPAYVSVEGQVGASSGTDSIATESIASIARRQNRMSCDFSDPSSYYRWLVTRVDAAFRHVDPWLDAVKPDLHVKIDAVKDALTPAWVKAPSKDPLGYVPTHRNTERAYGITMDILGRGEKPTADTLTDFADTAVSLDRDLLFAVQTYWVKLLREIGPSQRQSLFEPVARTWVGLNVIPPGDPAFDKVSPDTAPYIQLTDRRTDEAVMERYDRSVAMREVVDHTLDGLGFAERRKMLDTTIAAVRGQQDAIQAREDRLRDALGDGYSGLDIDGILHDRVDIRDPQVSYALEQLRTELAPNGTQARPMTPLHAEILRHVTLLDWVAGRDVRYGDPVAPLAQAIGPKPSEPLMVGEYWRPSGDAAPSPLPAGPSTVEVMGKPRPGAQPLKTSIVLEGGGGLGFAYVECLRQLETALSNGNGLVAVDEFLGTSAGAITASLLAGGYSTNQIGNVLQQLDFKRFYADYLWLAGGTDPQVRGINRTGLFSTRQMYQTVRDLLAAKVGVQGRPVLFRDLPFKLKIVSTVLNTDLPEDLKKQLGIGPDGMIVFSSENTPNMDVAAAVCGSAAVPTFFQAPNVLISRPEPDGQGGTRMAQYRLQLGDGGAVNNFATIEATDVKNKKSLMTMLPAYYQAPGAKPSDPLVSLSVLNFDKTLLAQVDAYNRQRYQAMAPQFAEFLQKAEDHGCERAVIGFNPAGIAEQPAPVVQGRTRAESESLRALAATVGFQSMKASSGAKLIRRLYPAHYNYAEQLLVGKLLDTEGVLQTSWKHGATYTIPAHEANGLSDVMISTSAAAVVGSQHLDSKLFEQAP